MDEETSVVVRCKTCGIELNEKTDTPMESRPPCPYCSSMERDIIARIHENMQVHEGFRAKSFPPNSRKFETDVQSGEFSDKDGKIVNKNRVIDRNNDIYSEKIVDESGNVLRDVNEKLTDHIGHGSAKFSKKKKSH